MNASPRSDFAPAEPHRGRAALKAAGSTIQTGWPAPAINPELGNSLLTSMPISGGPHGPVLLVGVADEGEHARVEDDRRAVGEQLVNVAVAAPDSTTPISARIARSPFSMADWT